MHPILAQTDGTIDAATSFVNALSASGLPIAMVVFGLAFLLFLILGLRWITTQGDRDSKRSAMDAQNLANALNNKDSDIAKALEVNTKATVAAAETALSIANRALQAAEAQQIATEKNTAAVQSGDKPRQELIAATQAQTAEFGGLRMGIDKQQATMAGGFDSLLKEFDDLKNGMAKLLKAVETQPDMQSSIMALLELNTKLLRKTLDVLTPRATDSPPTAASIAAASDAVELIAPEVNISPGPDIGIAS